MNEKLDIAISYINENKIEKSLSLLNQLIDTDNFIDAKAFRIRTIVHRKLKDYDKAIIDANKAIELDPDSPFAFQNRALIYNELKRFDSALEDFNKAINLDNSVSVTYYNRGKNYSEMNEHLSAIKDYDKAIELDPKNCDAFFRKGLSEFELKNLKLALKAFENASALKPNESKIYCHLAICHQSLRDFNKAISYCDIAITINAKYGWAYSLRSDSKHELKDFKGAIEDISKAIEFSPEYVPYISKRAYYYIISCEFDLAELDLNKVITINKNDNWATANLKKLQSSEYKSKKWMEKWNTEETVFGKNHCFKMAIELDETTAYYQRACYYSENAHFSKAIDDFSKYIELQPDRANGYYFRGFMKNKLGKFEESLDDCNLAINLNSNDGYGYFYKGVALYSLKMFDESLKSLYKAQELIPEFSDIYEKIGNIFEHKNNYTDAMINYKKAIEKNPKSPKSLNQLAWFLLVCPDETFRDYNQSLQLSQKSVQLQKSNLNLRTLAGAYAATGNFQKAIEIQEECIKLYLIPDEAADDKIALAMYQQNKVYF